MGNTELGLIGILSDTHDQIEELKKAITFFNSQRVELVVHCGDWVSPFTLKHYSALKAPVYGVFGNNDGDRFRHLIYTQKYGLQITFEDQFMSLSLHGKKMAVYHGDSEEIVHALVKCGDYDVVFSGHNHRASIKTTGKTIVFNPGTLIEITNEEIQGASIGIYDAVRHEGKIVWLKDI